jgi:hypothetical protein
MAIATTIRAQMTTMAIMTKARSLNFICRDAKYDLVSQVGQTFNSIHVCVWYY